MSTASPAARPKPRDVLTLALRADVDPRSARKWLLGEEVRGRAGERIRVAADALGLVRVEVSHAA